MRTALNRLAVIFVTLAACAVPAACEEHGGSMVFEGARLITGDGEAPVEASAFLVAGGEFVAAGRQGEIAIPPAAKHIDLTGKTVMPALLDAHTHLGYRKGRSFLPGNYTKETILDTLDRFAVFGVAAILEAGTARGGLPYEVRAGIRSGTRYLTCGSGFAMPNAGPGGPMVDAAFGVTTEEQARAYVRELAANQPDMIKIWVDDRNGKVEKLKPALYRAIIDEAHRHNLRVMAHIVALEDVKDLLRAGIDGFAHMIRDKDADEELLELLRARPNVFFLETLWAERRGLYQSRPAWADEPLLRDIYPAEEMSQIAGQFARGKAESRSELRAAEMAQIALRNTAKLYAAGVTLGLGTDTGGMKGDRYFGFGTHIELEILVKLAGLTPMQALTIGTRNTAAILGLKNLGTIAPGKSADFIVLDANPLDDISNTRRIARVYLRGEEVPRATLLARWVSH